MALVAYDNSSGESEEESKPVKKQKAVKITIPSLKEFEDDEEKPLAKKPTLQSGSGLFSLLPPPKNTPSDSISGFMPHILLSKKGKSSISPTQSTNNSITPPVSLSVTAISSSNSVSVIAEEQESDDEIVSGKEDTNTAGNTDFFWLDDLAAKNETEKTSKSFTMALKSTFIDSNSSDLPSTSKSDIKKTYLNETKVDALMQHYQQVSGKDLNKVEDNLEYNCLSEQQLQSQYNYINESTNELEAPLLNDKEFLKLQGRKREFENIDIVDVNADDQLINRKEWLMKNVTEEMTYRPKRKHNMPTQQQKRKHQITYLAFQAKEREMDLKNQWALNRSTRRETQSKYGF